MYDIIDSRARQLAPYLSETRRDLHKYAEPGWLEMRTASLIARSLAELGYEVLCGPQVCLEASRMALPEAETLEAHYRWAELNGGDARFLPPTRGGFTGVIGILHCGDGAVTALRFDIDALGVTECAEESHAPTALGFASVTKGVMHACGHDGHTAIGLGVARLLMEMKDRLHGTVKLIFQPAEEGVRGARSIVDAGHLDGVDYVLAAHILPAGKAAGVQIAALQDGKTGGLATSKLDVRFKGKAAHAGISPQEGNNALLSAATAVLNLHAIPRFGAVPTQLNVGRLTAGGGRNVVCEDALLEIEVRGATTEANDYMESYALRICEGAAAMHGCSHSVQRMGSAAQLLGSPQLTAQLVKLCSERLGMKTLVVPSLGGGSEDFAYMAEKVQKNGGQAAYLGLLSDCPAVNHNDRFDFEESALVNGVKLFCGAVYELLSSEN